MITEKEILDRLQNGENIDDIASNLTEIINSANKKFENERGFQLQKKMDGEATAKMLNDYLHKYLPKETKYEDFTAEDLDMLVELLSTTYDLLKDLKTLKTEAVERTQAVKKTADDDISIIKNFIKNYL